jgi:hypothetical protein
MTYDTGNSLPVKCSLDGAVGAPALLSSTMALFLSLLVLIAALSGGFYKIQLEPVLELAGVWRTPEARGTEHCTVVTDLSACESMSATLPLPPYPILTVLQKLSYTSLPATSTPHARPLPLGSLGHPHCTS